MVRLRVLGISSQYRIVDFSTDRSSPPIMRPSAESIVGVVPISALQPYIAPSPNVNRRFFDPAYTSPIVGEPTADERIVRNGSGDAEAEQISSVSTEQTSRDRLVNAEPLKFRYTLPIVHSIQFCDLAFCISSNLFYCQEENSAAQLRKMNNVLNIECEAGVAALKPELIVPEMPCCARYSEDGHWYRAKIMNCATASRGTDQVMVHFVDYGNGELVDLHSVRPLPDKFAPRPVQVIRCSLSGIVPVAREDWSVEACRALTEILDAGSFPVKILSVHSGTYVVEIWSVPDRLVEMGV